MSERPSPHAVIEAALKSAERNGVSESLSAHILSDLLKAGYLFADEGTLARAAAERAKYIEVIRLAYDAMNHMGDVLNGMDAVEPEDEDQTAPAFIAVRQILGEEA